MKTKTKVFWVIATIAIVLGAAITETSEVETSKDAATTQTNKPSAREVYDYYQCFMEQNPSPELDLQVNDFDTIDLFLEACNKVSKEYEKYINKEVAAHFGITIEEAEKLFLEGYHPPNE